VKQHPDRDLVLELTANACKAVELAYDAGHQAGYALGYKTGIEIEGPARVSAKKEVKSWTKKEASRNG
jgi:hypothetical protein